MSVSWWKSVHCSGDSGGKDSEKGTRTKERGCATYRRSLFARDGADGVEGTGGED